MSTAGGESLPFGPSNAPPLAARLRRWSVEGFIGRAPGGQNRWSSRERKPVPLQPKRVVEVSGDHITGDLMRHGARILRWRTNKRPRSCTMDQICKAGASSKNQRSTLKGVQPSAMPD